MPLGSSLKRPYAPQERQAAARLIQRGYRRHKTRLLSAVRRRRDALRERRGQGSAALVSALLAAGGASAAATASMDSSEGEALALGEVMPSPVLAPAPGPPAAASKKALPLLSLGDLAGPAPGVALGLLADPQQPQKPQKTQAAAAPPMALPAPIVVVDPAPRALDEVDLNDARWSAASPAQRVAGRLPARTPLLWMRDVSALLSSAPRASLPQLARVADEAATDEADAAAQLRTLRAMHTSLNLPSLRVLGYSLCKLWRALFERVRVPLAPLRALHGAVRGQPDVPVIYLPTHKSHLDYLLLSFVAYAHGVPVPAIAAGRNLDLPVLGALLRNSGSFFIRRSFRDDAAYKAALRAYVRALMREGTALEFFVEGGRSRTGVLNRPRVGMLNMVAQAVLAGAVPDALLVPVSIAYDVVPEAGSFADELLGRPKTPESLPVLARAAASVLGRGHGDAAVVLGHPMSLAAQLRAGADIVAVADRVVAAQNAATPVTASALAAAALLATAREGRMPLAHDLRRAAAWAAGDLAARGASTPATGAGSLARGLKNLGVTGTGPGRTRLSGPAPGDAHAWLQVAFHRNQLLHWWLRDGVLATVAPGLPAPAAVEAAAALLPLVAAQAHGVSAAPEGLREELAALVRRGVLVVRPGGLLAAAPDCAGAAVLRDAVAPAVDAARVAALARDAGCPSPAHLRGLARALVRQGRLARPEVCCKATLGLAAEAVSCYEYSWGSVEDAGGVAALAPLATVEEARGAMALSGWDN